MSSKKEEKALTVTPTPANDDTAQIMNMIQNVVANPEIDIDRLERMLDFQERVFDKNAELAFNDDLSKAQSEIESVVANKSNDQTSSRYANLSAIHKQCKPVWTRYGFSVISRIINSEKPNHIRVTTDVRHKGGHKEVFSNDWPLDNVGIKGAVNKTAIHAMGSTSSYARRYSEILIFDISVEQDDNDGQTQPQNAAMRTLNNQQINTLSALAHKVGKDANYVCQKMQVANVSEIQQGRLSGIVKHLEGLAK